PPSPAGSPCGAPLPPAAPVSSHQPQARSTALRLGVGRASGRPRRAREVRPGWRQKAVYFSYPLELHALIMCVDRLVTTAAALEAVGPVSLRAPVRGRLQRVAQACAQVRHAIEEHHRPDAFVAPQDTSATPEGTVVLPLLAEMERVLAMIPLAWPGRPSGSAT